jgi:ketosteroid isomerase-like protein
MMSGDGQALLQRYIDELWNDDDIDVADELYTEDHVYHDPYFPELPRGPEGVKVRARALKGVVHGRVEAIHDWVSEGDRTVCRWTYRGVNTGAVGDMEPTNLPVTIPGMHLVHTREGRIAESWVIWDRAGAFEQLGMVLMEPPVEPPPI